MDFGLSRQTRQTICCARLPRSDGRWAMRVFLGDGRIVIQVFPPRMPGGHELYVLQPISAEQYESAVKASTFCRN